MSLQDIINSNGKIEQLAGGYEFKQLAPKIICNDGTILSVQASETHYCTPRSNYGPYSHVEVGYPSSVPHPAMMAYAEEPIHPLDTVYGYVPVEIVQEFIKIHGGEKE